MSAHAPDASAEVAVALRRDASAQQQRPPSVSRPFPLRLPARTPEASGALSNPEPDPPRYPAVLHSLAARSLRQRRRSLERRGADASAPRAPRKPHDGPTRSHRGELQAVPTARQVLRGALRAPAHHEERGLQGESPDVRRQGGRVLGVLGPVRDPVLLGRGVPQQVRGGERLGGRVPEHGARPRRHLDAQEQPAAAAGQRRADARGRGGAERAQEAPEDGRGAVLAAVHAAQPRQHPGRAGAQRFHARDAGHHQRLRRQAHRGVPRVPGAAWRPAAGLRRRRDRLQRRVVRHSIQRRAQGAEVRRRRLQGELRGGARPPQRLRGASAVPCASHAHHLPGQQCGRALDPRQGHGLLGAGRGRRAVRVQGQRVPLQLRLHGRRPTGDADRAGETQDATRGGGRAERGQPEHHGPGRHRCGAHGTGHQQYPRDEADQAPVVVDAPEELETQLEVGEEHEEQQ
eukprot:scaffold6043_cov315-Pinguiococcus_pyrenoidosus.AAC.2